MTLKRQGGRDATNCRSRGDRKGSLQLERLHYAALLATAATARARTSLSCLARRARPSRSEREVLMASGIPAATVAALLSTLAASAEAQDSTYRSAKAHSGQRLQLSAHFTLKPDCSASPA